MKINERGGKTTFAKGRVLCTRQPHTSSSGCGPQMLKRYASSLLLWEGGEERWRVLGGWGRVLQRVFRTRKMPLHQLFASGSSIRLRVGCRMGAQK
ncbi:hypothetical protein CEXT_72851 [Caerostris extrusa]|uniref:Uncharacterized protein n=1 Tax=Caerostris extrusa TaxID=172846 RepID=A0AAV4S260_CAEEX|nr:hypothetical protein CEXT_72851 [Caerostris extrusa]